MNKMEPRRVGFSHHDIQGGVMREHELPTWQGMFESALGALDTSRSALSDAADWLRSDWRPLGSPLPDEAGAARRDVMERISRLKGEIDQAKNALWNALD
jgi:hypothetical protein